MSVPEASMDENSPFLSSIDDIGRPREITGMKTVPKAKRMHGSADRMLRLRAFLSLFG